MENHDLAIPMSFRRQCLVYVWYGKDGDCLYVGQSTVGLSRPMSLNHHALGFDGVLKIWKCSTVKAMRNLEAHFIRDLKPRFNRTKPHGEIPSTMERSNKLDRSDIEYPDEEIFDELTP